MITSAADVLLVAIGFDSAISNQTQLLLFLFLLSISGPVPVQFLFNPILLLIIFFAYPFPAYTEGSVVGLIFLNLPWIP